MTREHSIVAAAARRRRSSWPLLLSVAMLTAILVACTGTVSPTPTAGPTFPVDASGATPNPTAWPGSVVAAMIALGADDASFTQLGNDLQAAVDTGNMQSLLQVSTDGLTFLKAAQTNIPKIQAYSETKALGDALAAAYQEMIDGLQKVHDSLVSGDSAGVTTGFQQFVAGNVAYGALRADLSDKSQQAVFMQRIYLR